MLLSLLPRLALCLALMAASAAAAQDAVFGTAQPNRDLPVEVAADQLAVNQQDGTATFTGAVVITQGEMILSAGQVLVNYKEDSKKIASLEASGGITMVSGEDAAEAQNALYDIDAGTVLLTGNVLLSQGQNVMSGERITINLETGTATAAGRVKTTLQSGN